MSKERTAVLEPNILDIYYADNARKLHKTVDKILCKFGGLSDKDKDDFYSLANEVFVDVMKRYDSSQSFDGFLYTCLANRIKSEITKRNREKRKADRMSISLDSINNDDEECNLLDFIPADFDTFDEAVKAQECGQYQDKVQMYISRLSNRQVSILNLLVDGYKSNEIQEMLDISSREYADDMKNMKSYENIKILF
ncbi:MAG: hypothetical protein J1E98_11835 [Lachnospiraceae bacterium]|nr:hypothetical protein [Lachnospiraceae bacterium]